MPGASYARAAQLAIVSFWALLFAGCATVPRLSTQERYWEKFPEPPGRPEGFTEIGEDRHGGLWLISGWGTYFWNAPEKQWSEVQLRPGFRPEQLHGGRETGLYAVQSGQDKHWCEVFRLEDGAAKYVTRIYREAAHRSPGFRVAGKDRFINWGGGKLRIYADGKWIEQSADLPLYETRVLDTNRSVALYAKGWLYVVDRRNRVVVTPLETGIEPQVLKWAAWGRGRALVLQYDTPGVKEIDLATGRLSDSHTINQTLGKRPVYDLFSTPDGHMWVLAFDPALGSYVLFLIRPDGTASLRAETAGIPWDNHQFSQSPRSALQDQHGALWFASSDIGVYYLKEGRIHQFDSRIDNSPIDCRVLLQDRKGTIFAGANDGLYAYNKGVSLTGRALQPLVPVSTLDFPVWKYRLSGSDRLHRAWRIGGLIVLLLRHENELTAIDPLDGSVRFSVPLSDTEVKDAWVTQGGSQGELTLCLKDRLLGIDIETGTVLRTLECAWDPRIAPVAAGDDYILVKQYRGRGIYRVKPSGIDEWTCPLSGYVMTHPSTFGSLLLLQTRGDSYGKQATMGLNSDTGKALWNDPLDAYGAGTAFAVDGRYCVETACYLAPKTTEAWLIARNPRTGERLWHYRKSGTTVEHAPLLDPAGDRIYSTLGNGTILCLDGTDGTVVWETILPQAPARAPGASYWPYASCMLRAEETLAVVTVDGLLYLVDTVKGKVYRRIQLTEDTIRHGKRAGSQSLIAGPWIDGNLLIIPANNGVAAYSLE